MNPSLRKLNLTVLCTCVFGLFLATSSLQAQLVIGSDANDGSLKVRGTASTDEVLLEVDPTGNKVKVGSTDANENRDVELVVFDPSASSSLPENERYAMRVDASNSNVILGSGGNTGTGSDGDLLIRDNSGALTMHMDGAVANLILGSTAIASDGDITIRDFFGDNSFVVDGGTGNATNALGSEGLVKAWCQVDSAGNFVAGYRCTNNAEYPAKLNLGLFKVDFTALGTNIVGRPVVVSCTTPDSLEPDCTQIQSRREPVATFSSYQVITLDENGDFVDSDFTIMVF